MKAIKQLRRNVDGLRKMAEGYRKSGGFRELHGMLEKEWKAFKPYFEGSFLEKGMVAEQEFAEACGKLAECYAKLLEAVEKMFQEQK